MEIWKVVKDFPNYKVSNLGRVSSKFPKKKQKILSLEGTKDGYPCVSLYHEGTKKFVYVHHLVAETFIGKRPKGALVLHLNDVKTDNRVDNLQYGTHKENCQHKKIPFWKR